MRARTFDLLESLDVEAIEAQFDPIMSPLVWDLGHIGNFEEFWLLRSLDGRASRRSDLDALYSPLDTPRPTRGSAPILTRRECRAYIAGIRRDVLAMLAKVEMDPLDPLLA